MSDIRKALEALVALYQKGQHGTPINEASGKDSTKEESAAWGAAIAALAQPQAAQPEAVASTEGVATAWVSACPNCKEVIHMSRQYAPWTKPMGLVMNEVTADAATPPTEPAPQAEPAAYEAMTRAADLIAATLGTELTKASRQRLNEAHNLLAGTHAVAEPAAVGELPPLPETAYVLAREGNGYEADRLLSEEGYTADQMRDYARAALASAPHAPLSEIERELVSCSDELQWWEAADVEVPQCVTIALEHLNKARDIIGAASARA